MSIGVGLSRHPSSSSSSAPYTTATLPYPLTRHFRRSPSPTPSHSSSICSQATSIDSMGDMPRINAIRPMYHSTSSIEGTEGTTSGPHSTSPSQRLAHMEIRRDHPCRSQAPSSPKGKGKEIDPTPLKFPEEADEEILQESNSRFVLFPIKYREVSHGPFVSSWVLAETNNLRYGRRTKPHRRVSGRRKSWTLDTT